MKIISWNCKKNYSTKSRLILSQQQPDIVVIPECERLMIEDFKDHKIRPNNLIWFADEDADRGIAVFNYSNFSLKLLDVHNPRIKYVLPISVTNDQYNFTLLAIWTHIPYTKQLWNALEYYSSLIENDIIIVGDFNSNSIWDTINKKNSHSGFVKQLEDKNILSAYHHFYNEQQSKETHSTFYLQHNKHRKFHIDFLFASPTFIDKLTNVEVGVFEDWYSHSDHVPLTFTFEDLR